MALSVSRVGECDNRMVVYLDHDDKTKYKYVSNPVINLTCEVEAGSKSGYLCDVVYYTGEYLGFLQHLPMEKSSVCFFVRCPILAHSSSHPRQL